VNEAMAHFITVLLSVRKQRRDASLVLPVGKDELELAAGYFIQQWIHADRRNTDRWNLIRDMRSHVPYSSVLPPGAEERTDYRIRGEAAKGAGAADLTDGLLVSLLVDATWDTAWLEATCDELDDDGAIATSDIRVRHAARSEHATHHGDWIRQEGLTGFRSGAEIWDAWPDLYPCLERLPQVEQHLRELRQDWVQSVAWRLRELDDAAARWDPTVSEFPEWASHVTPEKENRKRKCWFTDLDGEKHLFDLHARVTPGEGRIHFRRIPERQRLRVAYIGLKIGI
jgi:hypothetical protein